MKGEIQRVDKISGKAKPPVLEYPPMGVVDLLLKAQDGLAYVPWIRLREDVRVALSLGTDGLKTVCWMCAKESKIITVQLLPKELKSGYKFMIGQCEECSSISWGDERSDTGKKAPSRRALKKVEREFGLEEKQ